MKAFIVSFLLFFTSILFISCSNEPNITMPDEKTVTPLAKEEPIINTKINHDIDTVIFLPESKETVTISKEVSQSKIKAIDKYLVNQNKTKNQSTTESLSPNYRLCPYDTIRSYLSQNQYRHNPDKHMGIMVTSDIISWTQAYNQYGFDELFIGPGDYSTATTIHFNPDSLMMGLPPGQLINDLNYIQNNPRVGYYYMDEPSEHNVSTSDTYQIEGAISSYPKSKFIISEYKWPVAALCNGFFGSSGDLGYLTLSNSGIMCDQYYLGNSCGDMDQYWGEYYYYGSSRSFMNWADNTGSNAGNWPYCFDWMNLNGVKNVWLYAYQTGNEGQIQAWCYLAWQKAWMTQFQAEKVYIMQNTDGTCSPDGQWTCLKSYYDGNTRWAAY